MKEPLTLEARIQAHYEELPPAERRLGDLLLSFPGDIATYSAGELAEAAGTSRAAASRFFQRLGYKDFNEVRLQVREARRWGSPVYLSEGRLEHANGEGKSLASQAVAEHLRQETHNLTRTLEAVRPDLLRELVDAIGEARRVHVVGFRNSRMLALYLQRQLLLVRSDVSLIPQSGQTLGEDLVDVQEGDVLVMVGMRRRVGAVTRIMEIAREQGARTLLITDPSATQTARLANWTLTCEVRSPSLLDSYAAAMSVLNLLCTLLIQRSMKTGFERLRRIEGLHEELDELDAFAWLTEDAKPRGEG
ncbi:MurR/RpiR family transcriptional regulator [Billgrantia kenyensis]|uniref:MurR/RpiR family transcriptional regulator n=1 Tax=Billgrantia kenyensis TaxID=321266 RepID=A0A7V9W3L8_9GAMM|nr:MurR/RpiR family transcriptional regulator [Halomonas kenyensis]MBA2780439.1 MurR/RpiR family transcriptional regulator [Halomonas kenyensis]MCG6663353.1 MurR/RpiR family transcriptional regulator [Halomonas kenyensis]